MRLQRLRLRIAGLLYTVHYVKGKTHYAADCFSRSPISNDDSIDELSDAVEDFSIGFINSLQVSDNKLSLIIKEQKKDSLLLKVRQYFLEGWPSKIPLSRKPYYSVSVVEDILCKAARIVIPESLRTDTLYRIYEGHLGIVKCLDKARSAVWWPNATKHIKEKVSSCNVCCRFYTNRAEL